ncbi:peptidylprolyl isomerase [Gillisia limnaea]|uniref:PpiC-type peptidyl-prolyl cis-trans isomerase n=1 Tax=Gillisia limnaea (strain DSM 15749 / LMG 21470 / R-8282) TaxID=865937 RepID=H2C061_GILLR|nr:peptidylprolyl isomerase [Gillisia limnaea]EHQ03477.1 PpiC-type peptidyl-prolyl cis-trans isomerase [Gillisia limnaea DSM 15749]
MQLKTNNLKFIINSIAVLFIVFGLGNSGFAQEVIVTDSTAIKPKSEIAEVKVIPGSGERVKVDGIAAVVGGYVVLDSDIELMYKDLKSQGVSTADVNDCQLAGSLLENKLYAHHAIQDSIIVADAEIGNMVDQQISQMVGQIGSMEKVLNFYKRDTEDDFRKELFDINKQRELSSRMQQKIVEDVEITPDEVRAYFEEIPEEERPFFGDEVEIAQIVIKPEIPQSEKQKVIDRLNDFRDDVVENGASFSTKAVLYSQDPGSASDGGKMVITRKDGLDKEFKDTAFSLQEGEVSEPFASMFGYHIIKVERVVGQNLEIRHILLIPDVTSSTVENAKKEIDSIRFQIVNKEITFEKAAENFSDEEQTATNKGKLINPTTGDTRFELTKIDPEIYDQVVNLEEGEVSLILSDQDRTGRSFFKLITVNKRYPEHKANFAQDYMKIKDLALRQKQLNVIADWMDEKIADTYIKINGKFRNCEYSSNWLKN